MHWPKHFKQMSQNRLHNIIDTEFMNKYTNNTRHWKGGRADETTVKESVCMGLADWGPNPKEVASGNWGFPISCSVAQRDSVSFPWDKKPTFQFFL